jgi:membrane-associated phospholipid phosphatase
MTICNRPLPSPRSLVIILLFALLGGIALGVVARGPNVLAWDVDVTGSIQQMDGGAAGTLADIFNLLGSTAGASVAITIAIVIAAVKRERPELIFLVTLLVLRLLGTQLKPLFGSPRPTADLVTIVGTFDGTGYPSGHALTASTMALGLAVLAWRNIPSRRLAIGCIVVLAALALLIGWARIWSGAHWASDVLGGYLFGVAIVAAATLALCRVTSRP